MIALTFRDEYIAGTYEVLDLFTPSGCVLRTPDVWYYGLELPIWDRLRGVAVMWRMWDGDEPRRAFPGWRVY
jgi:hypothetical protein